MYDNIFKELILLADYDYYFKRFISFYLFYKTYIVCNFYYDYFDCIDNN